MWIEDDLDFWNVTAAELPALCKHRFIDFGYKIGNYRGYPRHLNEYVVKTKDDSLQKSALGYPRPHTAM